MTLELEDNPMADELFSLVQRPAGYAHISDGISVLSEDEILQLASNAQAQHEECVKRLNAFLSHHSRRIVLKRPYTPMPNKSRL